MDHPNRFRLKILGHARITDTADAPELVDALADPSYNAIVERVVQVSVDAWDWNCTSHIMPRFTTAELDSEVAALRHELHSARDEISQLRSSQQ